MLVLGIETSTAIGTLALIQGDRLLKEKVFTKGLGHSDRLIPACEKLFKECKVTLGELDRIAVGIGPGSYTGLRVGLAAAKGLSLLYETPLIGIPSIDAIAWSAPEEYAKAYGVIDAKRQESYIALYVRRQNHLVRKGKIQIIANADLKQRAPLIGPDFGAVYPRAKGVAFLGAQKPLSKKDPEIIYIRPFVAKKAKDQKWVRTIGHGQK